MLLGRGLQRGDVTPETPLQSCAAAPALVRNTLQICPPIRRPAHVCDPRRCPAHCAPGAHRRAGFDRLDSLTNELNGILDWVEQLNEVVGVEPMTTPLPMRADEITDGGKRDDILANAPKAEEGFFVVPKSVE
jgi:aspartyl-tRNA(Asn)/glutamyl-tRNA(Gln) amidotransferase subunit C